MAVKLCEELKALGCDWDADEFRALVRETHVVVHPAWTDEELLYHPYDAQRFAHIIRTRTGCQGLTDTLILRTLVNVRKQTTRRRTGAA